MERIAQKILDIAGIKINGKNPWDIQVHNTKFYSRVIANGSLGLGESYMEGWWSVEKLDVFLSRLMEAKIEKKIVSPKFFLNFIKSSFVNSQTLSSSKKVAETHYDLGNDFYEDMLDKRMQYTCAYWRGSRTLDDAQENKLDLICRKLDLKKGERVLELGCGFGGFAKYAATKYGVSVTAYNISKEQVIYARKLNKGLKVKIVLDDYRKAEGSFDKVVSIGMCEHVGYKNYRTFMQVAHKCLKDGGLFLIHTIGSNKSVKNTDPWIEKYIFPNSMLPSVRQLSEAFEGKFTLEDWHNFGPDYDKTLMEWHSNFVKNWPRHKNRYDERFYRMWEFYLLASAASFRVRKNQLWQIVLSKGRRPGTYNSIR